ncbi:MAG: hypothetical protein AAF720_14910 [Pseudomonadota bacterium]
MGLFNLTPETQRDDVLYLNVRCITLNDEIYGLGAIGLGSEGSAQIIEGELVPLVEGENPFGTERLWTRMYRATVNIG